MSRCVAYSEFVRREVASCGTSLGLCASKQIRNQLNLFSLKLGFWRGDGELTANLPHLPRFPLSATLRTLKVLRHRHNDKEEGWFQTACGVTTLPLQLASAPVAPIGKWLIGADTASLGEVRVEYLLGTFRPCTWIMCVLDYLRII